MVTAFGHWIRLTSAKVTTQGAQRGQTIVKKAASSWRALSAADKKLVAAHAKAATTRAPKTVPSLVLPLRKAKFVRTAAPHALRVRANALRREAMARAGLQKRGALSPYAVFVSKNFAAVRKVAKSQPQAMQLLGKQWAGLTVAEKTKFVGRARKAPKFTALEESIIRKAVADVKTKAKK
jgi:hypothetical protein